MVRIAEFAVRLASFDRWLPDLLRRPWLVYAGIALVFLLSLRMRREYAQTVFALYLCVNLLGAYFGGLQRGIVVTGLGTLGLVLAALVRPGAGEHPLDVVLGTLTFLLISSLVSYLCDQGLHGLRQALDLAQAVEAHEKQAAAAELASRQALAQLAAEREAAAAQRHAQADAAAQAQARLAELEAGLQSLREQLMAEREAGARARTAAQTAGAELRRVATEREQAARTAAAGLAEAQRRLAQLTAEHSQREDERRRAEAQAQHEAAAQHEALRAQLDELRTRGQEHERLLADERQKNDRLQQQLARRADEAKQALAARQKAEQQLQEAQAIRAQDQATHRSALDELGRRHDEACAARAQLQTEALATRQALDALKQSAEAARQEHDELRNQHAARCGELTELQRRHAEAVAVYDDLQGQVAALEESVRRLGTQHGLHSWLAERLHPALIRAARAAERFAAAPLEAAGSALAAQIDNALRPALFACEAATLVQRLARGEVQPQREPIALEALVQGAVAAVAPAIAAQQQRCTVQLPLEPEWLLGDVELLTHALIQLLENAARHAGTGAAIELAVYRDGERLLLQVNDDGLNLPSELVDVLPQLSARAGRYWSDDRGKLGLGLALARDLVELHGGSLEVTAGPIRGLLLNLPAPPDSAPTRTRSIEPMEQDAHWPPEDHAVQNEAATVQGGRG